MEYQLIFLESAILDAQLAFDYYEKKQSGLGLKFDDILNKTIEYIFKNPLHFRIIKENYHQVLIDGFPYVIVYFVLENQIFIQRIFHTSRNPDNKFKRI